MIGAIGSGFSAIAGSLLRCIVKSIGAVIAVIVGVISLLIPGNSKVETKRPEERENDNNRGERAVKHAGERETSTPSSFQFPRSFRKHNSFNSHMAKIWKKVTSILNGRARSDPAKRKNSIQLQRYVYASVKPYKIDTKRTLGSVLCGRRIDRLFFNIVRGWTIEKNAITKTTFLGRVKSLSGVTVFMLVGLVGIVLSWCATLKLLPRGFVMVALLNCPACLIDFAVLNVTLTKRLLGTFQVWYLLLNIFVVVFCLSYLFRDHRIITLSLSLPVLVLGIFLDALPFKYRARMSFAYLVEYSTLLVLTQVIIFHESSEVVFSVHTDALDVSIPVTHVASSCNLNLLLFAAQHLFNTIKSPANLTLLNSPVKSSKTHEGLVDVEILLAEARSKTPSLNVDKFVDDAAAVAADEEDNTWSRVTMEEGGDADMRFERKGGTRPREI